MNILEKRILEISYKLKLSHIGSCLVSANIIDKMFQVKKKDEPFILSNGHAGLALYVCLEKWEFKDAEELAKKHGTHPNRDLEDRIDCSTGSLGQGLPIAVGMALADRSKLVYCLISDGEAAEGSIWEALRIAADLRLENLRLACVANGYGGYSKIDVDDLDTRLNAFYPTMVFRVNLFGMPDWIQGLKGHYCVMTDEQYKEGSNAKD